MSPVGLLLMGELVSPASCSRLAFESYLQVQGIQIVCLHQDGSPLQEQASAMERDIAEERERFEQFQEEAQSQAHALETQLNESHASAAAQLARVLHKKMQLPNIPSITNF